MHGIKPEHALTQPEDTLERVEIPTQRDTQSPVVQVVPVPEGGTVQLQQDIVKRFAERMKQELDGSSFSATVDRTIETGVNTTTSHASKVDSTQRKLRPLSKARQVTEYPLEGLTILDKLVTFVAYLLKRLEQRLLGGRRKPLTLTRIRQTIAAKKSRDEKARAKAQQKKELTHRTGGRAPLKGPAING